MELFTVNDRGMIVLNQVELQLIPSFKGLLDRDKTEDKGKAFKELAFVYFYCDYKSPHIDKDDDVRKELAAKEARLSDNFHFDSMMSNAVNKYNELKVSSAVNLLINLKRGLDLASRLTSLTNSKMTKWLEQLENTDFETLEGAELENYNNKLTLIDTSITRLFEQGKQIKVTLDSIEAAEERVKKENAGKKEIGGRKEYKSSMDPK